MRRGGLNLTLSERAGPGAGAGAGIGGRSLSCTQTVTRSRTHASVWIRRRRGVQRSNPTVTTSRPQHASAHPARQRLRHAVSRLGPRPESTLSPHAHSPVQIRLMMAQPPSDLRRVPFGRVYLARTRPTPTHADFSQIEGLVVDRGITFGESPAHRHVQRGPYFGPNISLASSPPTSAFIEPSAEFREITCTIWRGRAVAARARSTVGGALAGAAWWHPKRVERRGHRNP